MAVTRYWIKGTTVGGGSGVWNNTAHWSDSSGGSGGSSVPAATDTAKFDANGIDECVVDIVLSLAVLDIATTYTGGGGTDGHFDNATNAKAITTTGDINARSKKVSMGAATWTCGGNWNSSSIGTLDDSTSLILFDGGGTSTMNTSNNGARLPNDIEIAAGTTLNSSGNISCDGTITVKGTWGGSGGGTCDDVKVITGGVVNGTVRLGNLNTITQMDGTWTGNIDKTRGGQIVPATYGGDFYVHTAGSDDDWTPDAGTYIIGGDATFKSTGTAVMTIANNTNNPSWIFKGNVDLTPTGAGSTTWAKGTGTIECQGSAAQSIDFEGETTEEIEVDKSAGTTTFDGDVTCDAFLGTQGTIDFNGQTIETTGNFTLGINSQLSGDQGGAVLTVGGNLSLTGEVADLLTINNLDPDVTGTATATYCDVTNSDASAGTQIDATDGTNTDNGGNTNWSFVAGGILPQMLQQGLYVGSAA